jgi:hypothetical protein
MQFYLELAIPLALTILAICVLPERWQRFNWLLWVGGIYIGNQMLSLTAGDLTGHELNDADHWGSAISGFHVVTHYALFVPGIFVLLVVVPIVLLAAIIRAFRRDTAKVTF